MAVTDKRRAGLGIEKPPPGAVVDFDLPLQARQWAWIVVTFISVFVPTVFIVLRFYVKKVLVKSVRATDYVTLLAWIFLLANCILMFVLLRYGIGLHAWDVPYTSLRTFIRLTSTAQLIFIPTTCLTKLGILLQLQDMFVTSRATWRCRILWAIIGVNVLFFFIGLVVEVVKCAPSTHTPTLRTSMACTGWDGTYFGLRGISVVDDFIILLMPIAWVYRLQLPRRSKVAAGLVLFTGLLACCAAVMQVVQAVLLTNGQGRDPTYNLLPIYLWSSTEVALGLVVGCLPVMPRLFIHPAAFDGTLLSPSMAPSTPKQRGHDYALFDSGAAAVELDGRRQQAPSSRNSASASGEGGSVHDAASWPLRDKFAIVYPPVAKLGGAGRRVTFLNATPRATPQATTPVPTPERPSESTTTFFLHDSSDDSLPLRRPPMPQPLRSNPVDDEEAMLVP